MVRIHNLRQARTTKSYFAPLCSPTTENSESEKLESRNFVPRKILTMRKLWHKYSFWWKVGDGSEVMR